MSAYKLLKADFLAGISAFFVSDASPLLKIYNLLKKM